MLSILDGTKITTFTAIKEPVVSSYAVSSKEVLLLTGTQLFRLNLEGEPVVEMIHKKNNTRTTDKFVRHP